MARRPSLIEPAAVIVLPATPAASAMARRILLRTCPELPAGQREDALLLTSELVTNAVRYGIPPLTLRIALDGGTLHVDVGDANPEPPAIDSGDVADLYAETGRGLHILTAVATTWGHKPHADRPGKTVWFRLDIPGTVEPTTPTH